MQDLLNEQLPEKILKFCREKKSLLLLIFLPIITVIIGLVSWRSFDYFTSKQRMAQLAVIDDRKALVDKNHTQTVKFLNNELAQLNAQDPTTTTKKNELEQKIADNQPDYTAVLRDYEAFFEQHSASREGKMAGLMAAQLHLDADNHPKALAIFKIIFNQDTNLDLFYEIFFRPLYAALLEEDQQYQPALTQVTTLSAKLTSVPNFDQMIQKMEPDLLYSQARLAAQLNDNQTIQQATERLMRLYPTAEQTRLALTVQIVQSSQPQ